MKTNHLIQQHWGGAGGEEDTGAVEEVLGNKGNNTAIQPIAAELWR